MGMSKLWGGRTAVMAFAGAMVMASSVQTASWATSSTYAAPAPDRVSDSVAEQIMLAQDALDAQDSSRPWTYWAILSR
jgi:hypothetical protein